MTTTTPARLDASFYRLVSVLIVGVLAVVFDTTIVNVALGTLARDLHVTVGTIQWVSTGYLLAVGAAVPVTGWLTDRLGGRTVWMIALGVFLFGSIGASLSGSAAELIAWRIVQGIGGGVMLPVLTTLIIQAVGPERLGRASAVVSLPALLGPILGPLAGGVLLQHLSWRWIFWVNVPFAVVGLILAWRLMPAFPGTRTSRLDAVGLALASPGIAALVYGLSRTGLAVVAPVALGVVLLTAFAVRAWKLADRALVDLRLFRVRSFNAATGLLFLSGFALYGGLLLMPLYLQQSRGYTALEAGWFMAAQGVGLLASRGIAGRFTDTLGARWIAFAGLAVVAVATVPFALVTATTPAWWLSVCLVVRGAGLGAVTVPVMAAAYVGLSRPQIPHASILTRTAQQIGGSFGTAVLAVVLQRTSFGTAFWWSIAFTLIAVLLTLLLPTKR